jgi:hypothetical protein
MEENTIILGKQLQANWENNGGEMDEFAPYRYCYLTNLNKTKYESEIH